MDEPESDVSFFFFFLPPLRFAFFLLALFRLASLPSDSLSLADSAFFRLFLFFAELAAPEDPVVAAGPPWPFVDASQPPA